MEPIKKKKKLSVVEEESLLHNSLNKTSKETEKFNKLNKMVELEGAENLSDYECEDEDEGSNASDESYDDEFTCNANDVINFRLVRNENELELNQQIDINDVEHHKKLLDFHPQFSHQLFGEEEKIGMYHKYHFL